MWAPIFTKIGQHEGVGVLLNVIRAIEIGNEAETERTIVRQCDDLVSLASTSMVVSGLALTCSVPLAFQMLHPTVYAPRLQNGRAPTRDGAPNVED
jgi:hypothetical protein